VVALLVAGCGAFAVINYQQSTYQSKLLVEIQGTIEKGIAYNYINQSLFKTFRDYHNSDNGDQNMGQLFSATYDSLVTEDGRFLYGDTQDDESLQMYVAKVSADSVVLIAESKVLDPQDADFQNFSGGNGWYQSRAIITSKGVDYERQN